MMDIPYTQQFSVEQTPLSRLLPVLRQNAGNRAKLKQAIAGAFFKNKKTPEKIAANTLIALKAHGIITDDASLTDFGKALIASSPEEAAVHIAKNALKKLGGMQVVETLREMQSGGHEMSLVSIADELKQRGLKVSNSSSDLSGLCGWLRAAGVLKNQWEVDSDKYEEILGLNLATLSALKDLNSTQIAFLRAMLALNILEFTNYITVVAHAKTLFPGEVSFNPKMLDKDILQPLEKAGLVEVRRAAKSVDGARGGKPADVKPTAKFEKAVAEPLLASLFKNAGLKDLRRIRSTPLSELIANIRQNQDINLKGQALEMLAIRFCQLLGLEFLGWRETDQQVAAGGEVDGMMQSTQLIYSRWQIQCKATDKITYEMLAKEYGVSAVTLASVILIVSTGTMTPSAISYRNHILQKTATNLIVIEGDDLKLVVKDPSVIGSLFEAQSKNAKRLKQQLLPVQKSPPSGAI